LAEIVSQSESKPANRAKHIVGTAEHSRSEDSRTVSDLVFGLLNDAGGGFFSASKGNLLTGASSEPSVDALAEAIKRIRTQKNRNGRLIGLVPTTLLVPAALAAKARQVLNSQQLFRSSSDQLPVDNPLAAAGGRATLGRRQHEGMVSVCAGVGRGNVGGVPECQRRRNRRTG